MLRGKNLRKSYGNLEVLKGVDMEVQKAEIVSIVGASGAGKSTLLHILGTLDQPDSGSLLFNDTDLATYTTAELASFRNDHVGFIFQFHNLLPEFTAWENVCIPGFIQGGAQAMVQERAKKLLTDLGLSNRMDHKPSELSGGEQQRTAVARALINHPEIIFADEPSGNLDSKNAKELHELFFMLRDQYQQAFVIVTHNEDLAAMADRSLVMGDGKIFTEHEHTNKS